jgi:hypothetical protein
MIGNFTAVYRLKMKVLLPLMSTEFRQFIAAARIWLATFAAVPSHA